MALLSHGLLPATFRGAPFAVLADEIGGGRRIALHQYPGRDEPWAEDMGRAARSFRFRGFIVDGDVVFAGGPIQLQRMLLLAALEKSGAGTLSHPTLGILQVAVVRFSVGADLGAGRMASVDIEFVEAGKKTFPSLLSSSGLLSAANLVKVGLAVDAVRAVALAASAGGRRRELTVTAATYSTAVVAAGQDATALHRLAAQLSGPFGRFAGGGNEGVDGRGPGTLSDASTVSDVTNIASAARVTITSASRALGRTIASASLALASSVPDATSALVAALVAACADPADAIRLLEQLILFTPSRPEAGTPMGQAFGRMIVRAAVAELVLACGAYQPASSDDAAALIARVAPLLDGAATAAADAAEDQSFTAIRAARGAIVEDLRRRGATLARVREFSPGVPLPSLTLAQRYYREPARAGQLEVQARPPHPLFMPSSFQALAA